MKIVEKFLISCILVCVAPTGNAAKNYCGELRNHYGPLDYRMAGGRGFPLVEDAHFNEKVQNGLGGVTGPIGGDLDYTLRAIPNHPLALTVIGNVSIRMKTVRLEGTHYPTECYFERAIRFAPDDPTVRAVYGNYLSAAGKAADAVKMLKMAVSMEPDNPTFNYNLGLVFMKMKDYDNAVIYAEKAYTLGFPLPGLRNQLSAVGRPLNLK